MTEVMLGAIVRWALTITILCGVYRETGKWTVLMMTLVALRLEVVAFYQILNLLRKKPTKKT